MEDTIKKRRYNKMVGIKNILPELNVLIDMKQTLDSFGNVLGKFLVLGKEMLFKNKPHFKIIAS